MGPYMNMSADVKALAMATEEGIKTGKTHPFKCPIVDQAGNQVECKGNGVLADGQILGMNFFVKGIDERLPK
jgi:simple sugar transport system substrate-binding protein